jgi:Arc/MetJ-type ribon-helix-helix transcriptional regulator
MGVLKGPMNGYDVSEYPVKWRSGMGAAKVAITIREDLLTEIDRLVSEGKYPNRSRAIQAAVSEKVERLRRRRLDVEARRLDRREERKLAEEGLAAQSETWPAY